MAKTPTQYLVQIKTPAGYETCLATTDYSKADLKSRDMMVAGFDGRIITAKNKIVRQEWTLTAMEKC